MSDADFPAWAWAWVVAGIVAVPLLIVAYLRRTPADATVQPNAARPRVRWFGRAMLWWALGVLTLALAEILTSDPLTWAALAAFAIGYASLLVGRAWGPHARSARAWAAIGAALVVGYGAVLAMRAGHDAWAWMLAIPAAALVLLALHIARRKPELS